MKLKEWLKKNKIAQVTFAVQLGVTQQYLSKIIHKRYYPSRKLASNIELLTKGEIKAAEIFFDSEENR